MKQFVFAITLACFATSSVFAADLITKAPPLPQPTTWAGCYAGVVGGGNFGQTSSTAAAGPNIGATHSPLNSMNGGTLGGNVGCNYQISNWVFGGEGDFSWSGQQGSVGTPPPFNTTVTINENAQWLATIRGRVGYSFDRVLVFATGGVAWTQLNLNEFNAAFSFSQSNTLVGPTVGGGVEWMFAPRWSAKIEYLFVPFQTAQYFGVACCTLENRHLTDNIVRAGVDYHFQLWR
jgi:outer membrane immunogenic protein